MRFFISYSPIYAIEICGTSTHPLFVLSIICKDKKTIRLQEHSSFQDWESLMDALPNTQPTIWIINDEEVLTKIKQDPTKESSFEDAFPQIDKKSFYWKTSDQMWSLIRQNHWHYWVNKIQKLECLVIDIQLGNSALDALEHNWNQSIKTNHQQLIYEQGTLKEQFFIQRVNDTEIPLAGDALPASSLIGFAAVVTYFQVYPNTSWGLFRYLIPQLFLPFPSFKVPFEQQQKRLVVDGLNVLFRFVFLKWSVIGFGLLLSIGLGLQLWKSSTQKRFIFQEQQLKNLQQKTQQLDSLWALNHNQWKSIQTKSTTQIIPVLDQIFRAIPSGIKLQQFKWEKKQPLSSQGVQISIKGELLNKADLALWADQLQSFPTVINLRIAQLVAVPQSDIFHFELQIDCHASSS